MYGLIGGIVPDELFKECQRRLTTDTSLNLGQGPRWTGGKNWRPFDLIHRLREAAYSHAFSQLYAPGKLEEAKHVPPDAQMECVFGHYLLRMTPLILKFLLSAVASMT